METNAMFLNDAELHNQCALAVFDVAEVTRESEAFIKDEIHKGALRATADMRSTPAHVGDWLNGLRAERQLNEEYFNDQRKHVDRLQTTLTT